MSKKSKRDIAVFSRIQHKLHIGFDELMFSYADAQLTPHEKALKLNDRFDIEKAQKEKRNALHR